PAAVVRALLRVAALEAVLLRELRALEERARLADVLGVLRGVDRVPGRDGDRRPVGREARAGVGDRAVRALERDEVLRRAEHLRLVRLSERGRRLRERAEGEAGHAR